MTAALVLLLAVVATWLLRVLLITVIPAAALPERLRRALDDMTPAVMAALLVTHLTHGEGFRGFELPDLLAAAVAAAVAWWTRSLTATVLTGIAAAGLFRILVG